MKKYLIILWIVLASIGIMEILSQNVDKVFAEYGAPWVERTQYAYAGRRTTTGSIRPPASYLECSFLATGAACTITGGCIHGTLYLGTNESDTITFTKPLTATTFKATIGVGGTVKYRFTIAEQ